MISKYIENSYIISDFILDVNSKLVLIGSLEAEVEGLSLDFGIKLEFEEEISFAWVVRYLKVLGSAIDLDVDCNSERDSSWRSSDDGLDYCNLDSDIVSSKD